MLKDLFKSKKTTTPAVSRVQAGEVKQEPAQAEAQPAAEEKKEPAAKKATAATREAVTQAEPMTEEGTAPAAEDYAAALEGILAREKPSTAVEAEEALRRVTEREPFQYDYSADPLYRQYAESFTRGARQAAENTQARSAALTGGYGSSYGSVASQQVYDGYMQSLADRLPELYGDAYDRYLKEGEALEKQYGLLNERDRTAYDRYRDTVEDARAERDFAWQQEQAVREQENFLKELYAKYPKADPNYKAKSSAKGGTAAAGTSAANCEAFLAGLSRKEREKVYEGTDSQSVQYRNELISSLGYSGYNALKEKYPG